MPSTAPGAHGALVTVSLLLIDLTVSLVLLAGLRHVLDRARLRSWDRARRRFADPEPESDREPDPDRRLRLTPAGPCSGRPGRRRRAR